MSSGKSPSQLRWHGRYSLYQWAWFAAPRGRGAGGIAETEIHEIVKFASTGPYLRCAGRACKDCIYFPGHSTVQPWIWVTRSGPAHALLPPAGLEEDRRQGWQGDGYRV